MIGMARHGHLSSYYGQTAKDLMDLMDPFREEFELLQSLCARRLRLEVEVAPGVQVKMLNDYLADGEHAWTLPSLAYGGEAWAVVRLRIAPPATRDTGPGESPIALASFTVRYTALDGEPCAMQPAALALPALPVPAFTAIAEDELVARRADELEASFLQTAARRAAIEGDWAGIDAALQKTERLAARNPWIAESLADLRELAAVRDGAMFAKETAYGASRMTTRLAARVEDPGALWGAGIPAFLRRKSSQGKAERKPPRS